MEWCRKPATGREVAGAIRLFVNGRSLKLEYVRVLHERDDDMDGEEMI